MSRTRDPRARGAPSPARRDSVASVSSAAANRPLDAGGAISAMYMGATISAAPTPRPPTIRAAISDVKSGAAAEATADTVNSTAAILSTGLRPRRKW